MRDDSRLIRSAKRPPFGGRFLRGGCVVWCESGGSAGKGGDVAGQRFAIGRSRQIGLSIQSVTIACSFFLSIFIVAAQVCKSESISALLRFRPVRKSAV